MLPRYCTTSYLELHHFRKKEKRCWSDPDDVFTVARLLGQSCRHHCCSLYPLHHMAASTQHQCQVGCHLAITSNPSATQQVRGWEDEGKFTGLRGDDTGGEVCVRVQSHTLIWIHHGKVITLKWIPPALCRTVMLDRWGVELMCSTLRKDMDVLEYGSGGSTTFFRRVSRSAWLFFSLKQGVGYGVQSFVTFSYIE